jgi:hypothetical protein
MATQRTYMTPRTERRRTGITHRQQKRRRMARWVVRPDGLTHSLLRAEKRLLRDPHRSHLMQGMAFLEAKLEPGPVPNWGVYRPLRAEDFERRS